MDSYFQRAERTGKWWGKKARKKGRIHNWLDHPTIQRFHINQMISADPDTDWLTYSFWNFIKEEKETGLILGCGDGGLERHAATLSICREYDAIDISAEALAVAKAKAVESGLKNVNYILGDLNLIALEKEKYDVAFSSMTLHHVENLKHLLGEVHSSLKSRGIFFVHEYVGPSRFQWTGKQLTIMNDLLAILPEHYRRLSGKFRQKFKERVVRPSIEFLEENDPSEAPCSSDIIPLVETLFRIIKRVDYGGTILYYLLENIVSNFDPEKEEDIALLRLLSYFEQRLITWGIVPSDFTYIVAGKKGKA